jgi:Methylamine utilisation protein MauE
MDYQASSFMVGEIARGTLAAIFGLAAIHAMREWAVFGAIVEEYRLVPRPLALIAARILPPLELIVAAALLLPTASRIGAVLGFCLMLLFTAAIIVNIARGRVSIDCGCGGAAGQRLSAGLVLRNVGILLILATACMAPARGAIDATSAIGMAGACLALVGLYFAANQLMKNSQALNEMSSRSLS